MATKKLLPSLSVQWVFCCCLFYYRQMILVNIHYSQKWILVSYQTKVLRAGKKKSKQKNKTKKHLSPPQLWQLVLKLCPSPIPHPLTPKHDQQRRESMEVMFWRKFSITWSLNHTLPLTHGLQYPWAGAEERILFALIALAHPELGALAGKIPGNSIKPRVRHLSASPASFFQLYPYLHFHLCSLCQNKPRRREEKSHNKKFRWIHPQEIFG